MMFYYLNVQFQGQMVNNNPAIIVSRDKFQFAVYEGTGLFVVGNWNVL